MMLLYYNIIMETSVYDCINHIKYVSKKNPTFEKILASMLKLNAVDNPDADEERFSQA